MENRLSETLKLTAISLGLCEEWTREWKPCDQQELIKKYLRGIDFCIKHNYPTPEFITSNFDDKLLEFNGIYVGKKVVVDNAKGMYVFRGDTHGEFTFPSFGAGEIYLCENSTLKLTANPLSKVFINMYGDSKATIETLPGSKVYVYTHGEGCKVEFSGRGETLIRKKEEKK